MAPEPPHTHRALVVTTPAAAASTSNGAALRVGDVVAVLEKAGYAADLVTNPAQATGRHCLGVLVSYASARHARALRRHTGRVWLDAVDSWLLVDRSGLAAGHPSYLARAARDAAVLAAMPTPDLVTWISGADRALDRWTVRGRGRFVLPGRGTAPALAPAQGRRAVLAGDWDYAPNRDGLAWFRDRCLSLLEADLSGTDWHVDLYGAGAPPLPGRWVVHGQVADPTQLYRVGDVHLAPVGHGAGVKRKVLTPLLAGLPVVTTPSGAHGLRAHPLLSVASTPAAFAAAAAAGLRASDEQAPVPLSALVDADDTHDVLRALVTGCPHTSSA